MTHGAGLLNGLKRAAALLSMVMAATVVAPHTASASPDWGTPVIVGMGDGYMSGTADRWAGNSQEWWGPREFTDNAAGGIFYDIASIYGDTNGKCFRSVPKWYGEMGEEVPYPGKTLKSVNIACQGAKSENVWRAANGGKPLQNERPQADQLAEIAARQDVKVIALSVGAGDVGLDPLMASCVRAWVYPLIPRCNGAGRYAFQQSLPSHMAKVAKSVQEIHAVMGDAGYRRSQYRIVLQSYASPFPDASRMEFVEFGPQRTDSGCPMWNADLDWVRNEVFKSLSLALTDVARQNGADIIDMKDAFIGHELCTFSSAPVRMGSANEKGKWTEWARFSNTGVLQGEAAESLYPNIWGRKAMGHCLREYAATVPPERGGFNKWYCLGGSKKSYEEVILMPPMN
ncbi:GDSL-type esterase/lipase family protein [Streptomyces sp. NPDC055607]